MGSLLSGLSRMFTAMAAEKAKKRRKLVLTPGYASYHPRVLPRSASVSLADWKGWTILSALLTAGSSRASARLETAVQVAGDPGMAPPSNKTALGLVLRKPAPNT